MFRFHPHAPFAMNLDIFVSDQTLILMKKKKVPIFNPLYFDQLIPPNKIALDHPIGDSVRALLFEHIPLYPAPL